MHQQYVKKQNPKRWHKGTELGISEGKTLYFNRDNALAGGSGCLAITAATESHHISQGYTMIENGALQK